MIETLIDRVALSNLLNKMVERSAKNMMLTHARSRGATEAWIDSIKNLSADGVSHVVTVVYGEPDLSQIQEATALRSSSKWIEIKKALDKAKE